MTKRFSASLVAAATLAATAFTAFPAAAGEAPKPLPKQDIITMHRLSATLAAEAVTTAVAHCAAMGTGKSVVIVDPSGLEIAYLRGDNAPIHAHDSAYNKAYTATSYKNDTGILDERYKAGTLPNMTVNKMEHLQTTQGGLVIKIGNETIGGIGAAGGSTATDEECAKAGLDKVRDRLK